MSQRRPETDSPFADADLSGTLALLWNELDAAAASARHAFHLPGLSSVDDQQQPDSRIVVLRRVERDARQLMCHTDARSPKVRQLRNRPASSWLFYDGPNKLQLRAAGPVRVHTDDALADAQWQASTLSARRCYLAPAAPGTPSEGPSPNLPEAVRGRVPTADEAGPGRTHFAVLCCAVQTLDLLYLHHAGHRRARYEWDAAAAAWVGQWVEV